MSEEKNHTQLNKGIDLSYFSKHRASIIKTIAQHLVKKRIRCTAAEFEELFHNACWSIEDIEMEFDVSYDKVINLAYDMNPPNKLSMIVEFESIKSHIGKVPTKQEFDEQSKLKSSQYDDEFESWEHMLEQLEYDPWYGQRSENINAITKVTSSNETCDIQEESHEKPQITLKEMESQIQEKLKEEPQMLELFNILIQKFSYFDKKRLRVIVDELDS